MIINHIDFLNCYLYLLNSLRFINITVRIHQKYKNFDKFIISITFKFLNTFYYYFKNNLKIKLST